MRRASPWLPVLLLLALGAYLLPSNPPDPFEIVPTPAPSASLPNQLPPETLALFKKSRPATVRIESVNATTRTGGIGTGFFINDSGQLLTAYHVVEEGQLFHVTTLSGKTLRAKVTAFDDSADVALMQVEGRGPFPFLKLSSRAPRIGETVLAIGNSGGDYLQPRRGNLLRLNAASGRADFPQGTLEMNAPLAPGDSGGPIIDGNGQAIGVISYIRVDENNITRRSYAVPVVEGNALIKELREGAQKDTPVMGLVFDAAHSGETLPGGAVILRVARNSPAAQAGLRGCIGDKNGNLTDLGDVILSVNGTRTADALAVINQVRKLKIGETVTVRYLRGTQELETRMKLAPRRSVTDLHENPSQASCTVK